MDGELKNNHGPTTNNTEELERQKQWDAIAEYFGVNDNSSELEAAIEETKTPETPEIPEPPEAPEVPEPEAAESTPADLPEQDPSAKYISVEEDRKKERLENREEYKKILENKRLELAKAYANSRRLIPGHKNKVDFLKARNDYEKFLDKYLKLDAGIVYDDRMEELGLSLQAKLDELNESDEDFEAKKQALEEAYTNDCKEAKDAVNQNFLDNFLEQQNELSDETIKQINEGNIFRKVVHTFRSNKYIKGALIAAGVAGLMVATAGLAGVATGAVSVGFSLTAKGALAGAARGAVGGFLSSRQDAKNSAIYGFKNRNLEDIKQQFEELGDITEGNANTRGIANWLMAEYSKASEADRKDNIKRTAIATGLGAALGAFSSGIKVNKVATTTETLQTGHNPDSIKITNFDNVNIAEGHGAYDTFTQMGGDPDKLQQALDIMHSIDSKYGLVPGDSGVTGSFAHTYPGPISSWPEAAQVYIEEVAKEWAKQGLIPSETISGGPVYTTVTKVVEAYIPTGFLHYLIGAAAGTIVGDAKTSESGESNEPSEPEPQPTPDNQPVTPEASGGYYASIADEIEKQMAEREEAEKRKRVEEEAAAIEKQIAEREEAEKKRKAKLAEEEAAAIEKQIAEKEAAEALEAEIAEREAAEALEAQIAEREAAEATEASETAANIAADIEAQIAEREANERLATDIEAKIAERESIT